MFVSGLLNSFCNLPSHIISYPDLVAAILPNDEDFFDPAEQDTVMKENQNAKPHDTKSLDRETDTLNFESNTCSSGLDVKGGAERWDTKSVHDCSMDNKSETWESCVKGNLNENEGSLSCKVKGEDRRRGNEHSFEVEEYIQRDKNELRDSSLICISASDLFETETNLYSDKSVLLQCDLPDLMVSQKESNTVKDTCVDEGLTLEDKIWNECCKDVDQICKGLEGGTDNTKGVDEIECESKQESTFDKVIAKQCDLEDKSIGNVVTDEPKDECSVNRKLPVQYFVTESTVATFSTSDSKGINIEQLADQIPSESLIASSTEAEPTENIQSSNLSHNSMVETISSANFIFNSPAQRIASTTTETIEDINKQSVEPTISKENNTSDEQNVYEKSPVQNKVISDDRFTIEESNLNHNNRNSGNTSFSSRLQHDVGESSFSAAPGLITYSGPIAYSGNLSLRSDGSTTSGKSFAFPVLQSEWNSSPVRMEKADRRQFRKHRGWRSGLFCCRF